MLGMQLAGRGDQLLPARIELRLGQPLRGGADDCCDSRDLHHCKAADF